MPIFELRNETDQVRFLPGGDDTVTVFNYALSAREIQLSKMTMTAENARHLWKDMLTNQGYLRHS